MANSLRKAYRKADEWITNALIGAGYGITNQMEGLYQMAAHPVNTLQGLGAMASRPREIPGMVANALVDTAKRATSGPLGFGEVLGENLSPGMFRRAPTRNELITYHGSPHRINNVDEANPVGKFDLSKVGTGEGAQAYGHGIYLAEKPSVAKTYQVSPAGNGINFSGADYLPAELSEIIWKQSGNDSPEFLRGVMDAVNELSQGIAPKAPDDLRDWVGYGPMSQRQGYKYAADALRGASQNKGHFYTVDLPDEHIAKMLDWDAPLSEQPEAVRKAARELGFPEAISEEEIYNRMVAEGLPDQHARDWAREYASKNAHQTTGEMFYRNIAKQKGNEWMARNGSYAAGSFDKEASEILRSLGIPGIKYFDGGSRKAGEGTRNFVIFSPEVAKILKRE